MTIKQLIKKSLDIRVVNENNDKLNPESILVDTVNIDGTIYRRKRFSLNTKGCQFKTCSMCPLPNNTISNINDDDIFLQLKNNINKDEKIDILTIYHNGNFFHEKEISKYLRLKIYNLCNELKIKELAVESLPHLITEDLLKEFNEICPLIKLNVSIGLQTADKFLRRNVILSKFSNENFINANNLLRKYNYITRVFILFGIPFLDMNESIFDCIESVSFLLKNQIKEENIIICPLVVSKETLVYEEWEKGYVNQPTLENIETLIQLFIKKKWYPKISINSSIYDNATYTIEMLKNFNENKKIHIRDKVIDKINIKCKYKKENVMNKIMQFQKSI